MGGIPQAIGASMAARSPFGAALASLITPNGQGSGVGGQGSGFTPGSTGAWQPAAAAPVPPVQQAPAKAPGGAGDWTDMLRQAATNNKVNPDTAIKVAMSEGGLKGWQQSGVYKNGKQEPSYGPLQFLIGGGNTGFPEGMGNQFIKATGLDPRDPKNAPQYFDFAMKQASQNGWGQWYGAKKVGVGNWDGIGGRPPGGGGGTQMGTNVSDQKAAQPQSALDRVLATVGNPTVAAGAGAPNQAGATAAPQTPLERVLSAMHGGGSESQPAQQAPGQEVPATDLGAQDVATTSQALLQKSAQVGATNNKQARLDQLKKRLRYQA